MEEEKKEQKYYWLKLRQDFFQRREVKRIRKIKNGDKYVIIYLKMCLRSIEKGGIIPFTKIERTIIDEIAFDLDEKPKDIEAVLSFLEYFGVAEQNDKGEILLQYAADNIGKEGASAARVRAFRERHAGDKNVTM